MDGCSPKPSRLAREPSYVAGEPRGPERNSGEFGNRIRSVLEKRELRVVYQPAIRLDAPRVEFFEALARFKSRAAETPDMWFASAAKIGLGAQLEVLAVTCAIEGLSMLPDRSSVSINVSPATILTRLLAEALECAPLDRIILEITEKEAVEYYDTIVEALAPLRARGLRLAVDDAGAGYSSFRHILHFRPDFIKLDVSICRDIHADHMRRALASALVTFCRETGSQLVAEGVESADELKSLRALGMSIVQGHVFARPMDPEKISAAAAPVVCHPAGCRSPIRHAA
jgi:EAL domain-containing protein (putative c-di-GMP-specific phosphodiesterase class I)